jgi:hypothetical protein
MKRLRFISSLTLLLASSFTTPGHVSQQNRRPISVSVSVSTHSTAGPVVDMEIRRQIRGLGDVQVLNADADYELIVTLTEVVIGDRVTGYAMSNVIVTAYNPRTFRPILNGPLDPATLDEIDRHLEGAVFYLHSDVETGPTSQLTDMCTSAVAELDRVAIEPRRQVRR